ncbi:MAG: hypothetical protein VKL39_00960, partial [Leptolyngbyaceae bacterium]|nr:hypothetical protein [Leptolyngbyaceae bacterium]
SWASVSGRSRPCDDRGHRFSRKPCCNQELTRDIFLNDLVPLGVSLLPIGPHPESLSQTWERDFKLLAPLLPVLGEGVGG